jgi:DNA polymerase-1
MGEDVEIYKYQTGKVELERFKDNELVNKFLLYKKYQKAVTTYGLDWLNKFINSVTKRVHSSFDQIKSTGRLGSYSPNVQQIPSFKSPDKLSCEAHRTCFVAPEGWSLITKDFSGCELRILADYSNEQSMIDEFVLGTGDLHSLTASKVFRKKVDSKTNKHLRQIGKTLNFAIKKF